MGAWNITENTAMMIESKRRNNFIGISWGIYRRMEKRVRNKKNVLYRNIEGTMGICTRCLVMMMKFFVFGYRCAYELLIKQPRAWAGGKANQ